MVNILFSTSSLAHDGTQTFIMNVYRNLDKTKFRADFLVYNDVTSDFSEEVRRQGSSIYVYPPRREGIKSYIALNRFFKEKRGYYTVFHQCSGSMSSVASILFAYSYGIPVRIVHSHNSNCNGWHTKVLHFLLRGLGSKLATHSLACSDKAGKFFFNNGTFQIINNGINVKQYSFNSEIRLKVRKELNIEDNCIVIGNVGRFMPVKNHDFILKIFKELQIINMNVRLLLIGSGPLEEQIILRSKEMGVFNNVLFLGARNDVPDLMQAMDCFLMPSLFEGLPFVLIEAQASGLPCFISDIIDHKVDITSNVNFISLNQSPKYWAEKITKRIASFTRVNHDQVLTKAGYDIIHTTRLLEDIYIGKNK